MTVSDSKSVLQVSVSLSVKKSTVTLTVVRFWQLTGDVSGFFTDQCGAGLSGCAGDAFGDFNCVCTLFGESGVFLSKTIYFTIWILLTRVWWTDDCVGVFLETGILECSSWVFQFFDSMPVQHVKGGIIKMIAHIWKWKLNNFKINLLWK